MFLFFALMSYHPSDPSFNSTGTGIKINNYCGILGSYLADALYQILGISSALLIFLFLRGFLIHFLYPKEKVNLKSPILGSVYIVLSTCNLVGIYFPNNKMFSEKIPWAGTFGVLISRGFMYLLNFVGAAIVSWTLLAIVLILYTDLPYNKFFKQLLNGVLSLSSFFQKLISQRKKEKQLSEKKIVIKEVLTKEGHQFPLFKTPTKKKNPYVPVQRKEKGKEENWILPELSLLVDPPVKNQSVDEKEIKLKARTLTDKLAQFSINGQVVGIKPGPAVTLFEFKPAADVKISRIADLADDLSLALSSESVRIIAPIPGRDVVGIETSNSHQETVYLKEIISHQDFWDDSIKLPVVLGQQADGEVKVVDLRKMPHLLVAGYTGSGKSVFVMGLLMGLLFRHSPKTLRLVLIDPKQVDLSFFNHCPHLIIPPIREIQKAVLGLKWALREMEKRYRSMSKWGVRGLEEFNDMVIKLTPEEKEEHLKYHSEEKTKVFLNDYYFEPLPYLVIVIEEFGDLMAVDRNQVENSVVRLAQMARACGIHLILAMQSPRRDVVTGLIKTNVPGRVSFKVASKMDSRIILDGNGAERLLFRGDMLFLAPGVAKPERHHAAYVSEKELNQLAEHWACQGEPQFDDIAQKMLSQLGKDESSEDTMSSLEGFEDDDFDDRYDEIFDYVSSQKEISASLIQRRFRIGYPRAARLIEMFEMKGLVGPASGSKPRVVLKDSQTNT